MDFIAIGVSSIFLIVSSILALKSKLPKQTIDNQKDLIETYEKRLKALEDQAELDKKQHIENVKAIAELQGQIKVYKELPLQQIADSMKQLTDTNSKILRLLDAQQVVETTKTVKTVK